MIRGARARPAGGGGGWRGECHNWTRRTLRDLPWAAVPIVLHVHLRNFRCVEPDCPQRFFTERRPELAPPYAHATLRRILAETAVGVGAGGEPGARFLRSLGIDVSGDTLLRRVRKAPEPPAPETDAVGIDDWAWRKGQRYGSILVDLRSHRLLDLLPDREVETVAKWLERYGEIRVLSRDRYAPFAEAGRRAAPRALQTVDRFHLLVNLSQALERYFARVEGRIRKAVEHDAEAVEETSPAPALRRPTRRERLREASRQRRQARYEAIQERVARGLSLRAIANELVLDRKTVRRYARAASCPEPAYRPRAHALDRYRPYLERRWREGERNARRLTEELRAMGFRGSASAVRQYVASWRQPASAAPRRPRRASPVALTPRRLARLLGQEPERLDPEDQKTRLRLLQADPECERLRALVAEFRRVIHEHDEAGLLRWIRAADASGIEELVAYARQLRRDLPEVAAAVRLPWSNGAVEGKINRLKTLKRSMYGRGKIDLLRKRLLLAG